METNAFLNYLFTNRSFHSPRHYFFLNKPLHMKTIWKPMLSWIIYSRMCPSIHLATTCKSHFFIGKLYGHRSFLEFCMSEAFLQFTSPLLLSHFSYANSMEPKLSCILYFRIFPSIYRATTCYSRLQLQTIGKQMLSWILYFRIFPSIHLATTC